MRVCGARRCAPGGPFASGTGAFSCYTGVSGNLFKPKVSMDCTEGNLMTTRNDCIQRDAQDPLAALRDRFDLPPGVIYLDGNSLGARPKAALARAQHVIAREWGNDLIRSWNTAGWFDLPKRLGNR